MTTGTQETRPETVVTKDGTSINIYIGQGGQPITGQAVTPTTNLMSVVLWGVIAILAIPLILPQLGLNLDGVKNTWQQWQMSLSMPVPMAAPTPVTMVTPMVTPMQEPVVANVPSEPILAPTVTAELQTVALTANRKVCTLSAGRVETGLRGYSRPVADESIDNLPSQLCYRNCIMQIESASSVELFNGDTEMRLVGSWYSTGKSCDGSLNELAENKNPNQNPTQAGLQKTFWITMLYGWEYAQEQLQKKLNGDKGDKPETGKSTPTPGWSLWELLPETVKGWGMKGLAVLVALLLIITNFSGGLGRLIAVVVVVGIFWLVFWT
jgi:hypothetical protein